MELKFVAAKKPESVNATVQRRQRLVRRIDQQINLLHSAGDGVIPRSSWLWMDDKGSYYLPVKYGRQCIELRKGMNAIQCENIEQSVDALEKIRAMVLNGEFDDQLAKASGEIRARFRTDG